MGSLQNCLKGADSNRSKAALRASVMSVAGIGFGKDHRTGDRGTTACAASIGGVEHAAVGALGRFRGDGGGGPQGLLGSFDEFVACLQREVRTNKGVDSGLDLAEKFHDRGAASAAWGSFWPWAGQEGASFPEAWKDQSWDREVWRGQFSRGQASQQG